MFDDILDLEGADTSGGFAPLDAGKYEVTVKDVERVATKKGGAMLKMKLVLDNGRVLFHQINIANPPDYAPGKFDPAKIGKGEIIRLATAGGINTDSKKLSMNDLAGLRVLVTVGVQDKQDGYGPKNTVKKFEKAETPSFL